MEKDNETYYGVLMTRELIVSGIYLFRPVCLIEGKIDTTTDNKLFVDVSSRTFYMSEDGDSLAQDDIESVSYVISKKDLLAYDSTSIENAMSEYFEKITGNVHIGFYITSDDVIQIVPYDLETTYVNLNNGIPESDVIECNLDVDNLSDEDKKKFESVVPNYQGDTSCIIPLKTLEDIVHQKSLDDMKNKLEELYFSIKLLEDDSVAATVDNGKFVSIVRNISCGDDIIQLFIDSYDSLLSIDDMETMKSCLASIHDMYEELYHDLEENKDKYDSVEAARDFLILFIDTYEKMLSMDSINNIKNEIEKIKKSEESRILEIAAIYDENHPKETTEIKKEEVAKIDANSDKKVIDINELEKFLDKKVIGQEEAKADVIQTIFTNLYIDNPKDKLSCLLVGPTGSGKTFILEQVSEYLNIPIQIIDTTQLTMPGYVGANIEDFLSMLLTKAGGDVKKAERGIVVFDEIDKKGSANNADVSGKGVLNQLLPFMDGTTYQVPYNHKTVLFNTSNLTVFATGAFTDIVKEKKSKGYVGSNLGFCATAPKEDISYGTLEIEDFEKYGLIPVELIGRIPIISQLSGHTKETLTKILLSEYGILSSFKNLFLKFNVCLEWTDGYIDAIAEKALKLGTGARSLKSIVTRSIKAVSQEIIKQPGIYGAVILSEATVKDNKVFELIYNEPNNIKDNEHVKMLERKGV